MIEFQMKPVSPEAVRACEARARQMRAQVFAQGLSFIAAFFAARLARRPAPLARPSRA